MNILQAALKDHLSALIMTDMQESYTFYPNPRTSKLPNKSRVKKTTTSLKDAPFICEWVFCGKEFPTAEELRNHIDIIHTVKGQSCANSTFNRFPVSSSSTNESTFAITSTHTETEWNVGSENVKCETKPHTPKLYYCHMDDCKKGFRKSWHLKAHIRSHTGERPFACQWPLCEKRFTRSDKLYRHMNVHTKGKHFACPVCTKTYVRNDNLTQHLKTHTLASTSTDLSQCETQNVQ
uniref:C2H2-type domain-containing protein n=1 Tax=Strigamia maritima TaxID=126957 RepID=T1J0U3_STRMM